MKRTKPSCLTDEQWLTYLSIKLKCELRKLAIIRQKRLPNGGNSGIINIETPPNDTRDDFDETKHPRDNNGRFTDAVGISPSPSTEVGSGSAAAADHIIKGASAETQAKYEQSRENEKKITHIMESIAAEIGAEMTGLEHSVKTASSVADKLERKLVNDGIPQEKAIAEMNDLVRYTQLGKHSDLVNNALATKKKLEQRGFEVTEVDNKYLKENASYKGIHMTVESPEGQTFELQFHSQESMAVKNKNHTIYEEARNVNTSEERRNELDAKMKANTASLPDPDGVELLQNYKKGETLDG